MQVVFSPLSIVFALVLLGVLTLVIALLLKVLGRL
jgi:hypothetical protein